MLNASCEIVEPGDGTAYEKRQFEAIVSVPEGAYPSTFTNRSKFGNCPFEETCGIGEPCMECDDYTGSQECPNGFNKRASGDPKQSFCRITEYGVINANPNDTLVHTALTADPPGPRVIPYSTRIYNCPLATYKIEIQSTSCEKVGPADDPYFQKYTIFFKMRSPVGGSSTTALIQDNTFDCDYNYSENVECEFGETCLTCESWSGVAAPDQCPKGPKAVRAPGDPEESNCKLEVFVNPSQGRRGSVPVILEHSPYLRQKANGSFNCPL